MSLGHLVATAHGQLQCHLYLSITTPKLHQYPDSWVKWPCQTKICEVLCITGKRTRDLELVSQVPGEHIQDP